MSTSGIITINPLRSLLTLFLFLTKFHCQFRKINTEVNYLIMTLVINKNNPVEYQVLDLKNYKSNFNKIFLIADFASNKKKSISPNFHELIKCQSPWEDTKGFRGNNSNVNNFFFYFPCCCCCVTFT